MNSAEPTDIGSVVYYTQAGSTADTGFVYGKPSFAGTFASSLESGSSVTSQYETCNAAYIALPFYQADLDEGIQFCVASGICVSINFVGFCIVLLLVLASSVTNTKTKLIMFHYTRILALPVLLCIPFPLMMGLQLWSALHLKVPVLLAPLQMCGLKYRPTTSGSTSASAPCLTPLLLAALLRRFHQVETLPKTVGSAEAYLSLESSQALMHD
jgi:hypothetical protein